MESFIANINIYNPIQNVRRAVGRTGKEKKKDEFLENINIDLRRREEEKTKKKNYYKNKKIKGRRREKSLSSSWYYYIILVVLSYDEVDDYHQKIIIKNILVLMIFIHTFCLFCNEIK